MGEVMNITFEEKLNGGSPWHLVYLDGRQVGVIKGEGSGFKYYPHGAKKYGEGEIFPTLTECKRSLSE
jgi:hypothetical protein